MNRARLIRGLAIVTLLLPWQAHADQNDARLDSLFEVLAETTDTTLLAEVEGRIWAIWYAHPDREAAAMLAAGERLMNSGFYGDALQVFSALIDQQPDYAEAWNRRATLHYLMGRYADSISDIDHTLTLEPRHFGALSGLGLVYLRQDNLTKAREAFENLLQIHPNSPAGRQNLQRVLDALRSQFI
jgi:tetratricopeptide (TPR) repeat protein